MKSRLAILIITVVAFLALGLVVAPKTARALDPREAACQGVQLTGGDCNSGDPKPKIDSTVATVINIFSWIVGVTAVIMVIIGGFKYVTSQGDSNNINSAKNTILYAIIGLIVVAMAQIIVKFVLNRL